MALPAVDFNAIAKIAHEAIQSYGTPATFTEEGSAIGRPVKVVIFRDDVAQSSVQEMDSVPAKALLDTMDFQNAFRAPQQFDQIQVTADGVTMMWTISADPHPVYAANRLPIFIAELRRV